MVKAAGKLEKMECRAILAECGHFAYFQKEIAARMKVAVFMSSLLHVPWAQSFGEPSYILRIRLSCTAIITDMFSRM